MKQGTGILGLIVARGGSKGVPRKNLRLVGGKPLLHWTFEAAQMSRLLTRTILSTDDEVMVAYARSERIEVPFMRPPELATDAATAVDVTLHALQWLASHESCHPDYVVLLQPTSPLRTAEDIDGCVEMAMKRGVAAVISVVESREHPCLMRTIGKDGELMPFIHTSLFESRKQDLPPVYSPNGAVYVARSEVLKERRSWHPEGALACVMPAERSLDIDTEWDLGLADMILRSRITHEKDLSQ
ncbi:MAG: acylneuraminate cytidylyltransferase family protein [bacterium]